MSNTVLISLRIPRGLLVYVDAMAKRERRSRAGEIVKRLYESSGGGVDDRDAERDDVGRVHGADEGIAVSGGRDRAAVPVLRKTKGKAKLVHSLQSVRDELAGRRGPESGPEVAKVRKDGVSHEGHRVLPNGSQK